jgi:hypothetical protein
MNHWILNPYQSVGPLRFGISMAEAESILGTAAIRSYDADEGVTTLYWDSNATQLVFEGRAGGLSMVSLYGPDNQVSVSGEVLDWRNSSAFYEFLKASGTNSKYAYGISIFFDCGIAAAGLHGDAVGDKSVTAFAKGKWDPMDPMLSPLE